MERSHPKVGAGAVVIKDGMTLLAKRKGSHGEGMWGSFGGHVRYGESPVEALKREAMEELGIEVGNVTFVVCTSILKEGKHYIDVSFTAEIVSGEPRIMEPERIEEVGWFPIGELPSPLFEPVRMVFEGLRTGKRYFELNG